MTASHERISAQTNPMERELTITRLFDAPRELVFKAWTEPERLKRWWGPHHFTNPSCEVDLRPGGKWHIVMRAPDGKEYPCGGVYREIVTPEKLVFTNIATDPEDKPIIEALTSVTLEEVGRKTKLTLHTTATAMVDYAAQMLAGMEAGWTQSMERLEQVIESDTADRAIVTTRVMTLTLPSDLEILMTRTFDAPRKLVFDALTKPEHLTRWWGPYGTNLTTCQVDCSPGGEWRYVLAMSNGKSVVFKGVFQQIVPPERLVFTECFDDPSLGSPEWLSTVTLEEHNGTTTLTRRILHKRVETRNGQVQSGMERGAGESYDRLAELLHTLEK